METNSPAPLTPPSPPQTTFVAAQEEQPKRKLSKILLALFVVFILFDIGIGTYLLLGKNKNQRQPEAKDITNNLADTNSEKCDFIKNIEKKNDLTLIEVFSGEINPNQDIEEAFEVDDLDQMEMLTLSQKSLNVTLFDPSGKEVEPVGASPQGASFQIPKPEKGKWGVKLSSTDAQSYSLSVGGISNIFVYSSVSQGIKRIGDSPHICAIVFEGNSSVINAKIESNLVLPDGTKGETISLFDDGKHGDSKASDGIYASVVSPLSQEGVHQYSIKVSGKTSNQSNFQRIKTNFFEVLATSHGVLKPDVKYTTTDKDSDGLIDELVVEGEIEVKKPGKFSVEASLLGTNNERVAYTQSTLDLTQGLHPWKLSFSGRQISSSKQDGPYKLSQVKLYAFGSDGVADLLEPSLVTESFRTDQFQREHLVLGSNFKEEVIDTDGDGKYNILRINVSVDVVVPETYSFQANIEGTQTSGQPPGAVTVGKSFLKAGTNTLTFDFSGYEINSYKLEGVYKVTYVSVAHPTNGAIRVELSSLGGDKTYTTKTYSHTQFDSVAKLTTSISPINSGNIVTLPISQYNDGRYDDNTNITLKAEPLSGKNFARWLENNQTISTDNPLTIKLDKDRAIVVEFR